MTTNRILSLLLFTLLLAAPSMASAKNLIVVDISDQQLTHFVNGKAVSSSPVSTGKAGHRTPTGTFNIKAKWVHHRSSITGGLMPYTLRLTDRGVSIHSGHLPGVPASLGCIRLPHGYAQKLYHQVSVGDPVKIVP